MASKFDPFVKAVLYADIFDFPLTASELWKFAIRSRKIKREYFEDFKKHHPAAITEKDGFFYRSDKDLVSLRKRRNTIGKRKLTVAKKIAKMLAKIPTVLFVGVSGGLALQNAEERDDIDFFIITKAGTAWTTRIFVVLLLEARGIRRRRGDSAQVADKICVNMYLDETNLGFLKDRQDLYTAHEVVQLLPLVDKKNTYNMFVSANRWVEQFLPNGFDGIGIHEYAKYPTESLFSSIFQIPGLEFLLKNVQLWYMQRHMTREEVTSSMLAFHPVDYRKKILDAYEVKIKNYENV